MLQTWLARLRCKIRGHHTWGIWLRYEKCLRRVCYNCGTQEERRPVPFQVRELKR
jgi:hypothetical protein